MQYRVEVREVNIGIIDVEAETIDEAEDLAMIDLENGNVAWVDSESSVTTAYILD